MNGDESLDEFAELFSRQLRLGQVPSAEELKEEFPALTEDLNGFVKTLSILEEASFQHRIRGPAPTVADASGQRWTRVGGFRLIREISRGGMGIVYEAEQEALQRRVAIKVLPSSPMLTETQLERFRREGTAIARLHHSHIVPVFGTGEQNGIHYCVMQYIEGCSLDRLIRALRRHFGVALNDAESSAEESSRAANRGASIEDSQHPEADKGDSSTFHSLKVLLLDEALTDSKSFIANVEQTTDLVRKCKQFPATYWKKVARIGADMADALSHAHSQGILHRDVKPANLLMDQVGQVWLADFGVAKLTDHDNLTATGGLIGTLRYASPEQLDGHSDARSDIYSLGLTLYELCALQPAFNADDKRELIHQVAETAPQSLAKLMKGIPADLETVIHKAMAPSPADRYQRAAEFAADLRSFIADRPVTARRLTLLERSWRWCRRHRTETALGAVIAMLLISFGLTSLVAYLREARLRGESEDTARTAIAAINRVYDSFVPDWTNSSTVSAHGSISVTPATAQLLSGLLQFYDELAERARETPEEQDVFEVTAALRRVALIYHRLGMFGESKDVYGRALARLSSLSPQNAAPRVRLEHARLNNEIGAVYWTDRQIAEATESHFNALRMLQSIPQTSEPQFFREVQFETARTEYLLGRRARGPQGGVPLRPVITRQQEQFDRQTRTDKKRAEYINTAIRTLEELVSEAPSSLNYRHLLALCCCELSEGTVDEDHVVDASIVRAIELLEQLVKEDPKQPAYRYALCSTLLLPKLSKDAGDAALESAAARVTQAIRIAEELSAERPDEWIYAASQVEAHMLMASVQTRSGAHKEAHASSLSAIQVGSRLAEKYPNCHAFQYWTGIALQSDGNILLESGESEQSLEPVNQAMTVFRHVLQVRPEWSHVVLRDLKNNCTLRAQVLTALGKHDEAEMSRQESADFSSRLSITLANSK